MRTWAVAVFLLASSMFIPDNKALAGGVDYAGAGAEALGRGGAVAARADDPMVLMYNPAGLVELRGSHLMLSANVALMNACVDPLGYYGWGAYAGGKPSRFTDPRNPSDTTTLQLGRLGRIGPAEQAYYNSPYDTVCMQPNVTPVPEFGLTARITEDFGIGIGMMYPAVTPQGRWGGDTGLIRSADGTLRPAATRYMMLNSSSIGMFPTFGAAYRLTKWLRVGAAFQWGVIHADNTTVVGVLPGTTPANDFTGRVKVTDWFVPAVTASIHVVPTDSIDFVAGFYYQDSLDASGTVALTTGLFDPTQNPHTKVNQVSDVRQKFPWQVWGAFRYSDRLAPRPTGDGNTDLTVSKGRTLHDAFADERFDIEVDVHYEANARHRDVTLDYPVTPPGAAGQTLDFEGIAGAITSQAFPDPSVPRTIIEKHWRDQVSVRLGGTYNVLPGLLGLSFGAHYENRGVDPSYMQIDYWPVARVGLHAGVRVRVGGNIDVFASYAHIFQETLTVGAPEHDTIDNIWTTYDTTKTISKIDKTVGTPTTQDMPLPVLQEQAPKQTDGTAKLTQTLAKVIPGQPPYIVNAGTYRSSIDVLSLGFDMHF